MTDRGDAHVEHDLGAYVLGALDPVDRHRVEAHVTGCRSCRDELARLSGLPALLDRLSPEEVQAGLATGHAAIGPRLLVPMVDHVVDLRRAVRRWRVAASVAGVAAAAAVVALVAPLVLETPSAPDGDGRAALVAVAADAAPVEGTAAAYAWDWGTTIQLEVGGLPSRPRYVIWVVDVAGDAQIAGTWGPTADRSASVRSATALPRTRVASVEVRDDDDDVLLAADLSDDS